MASPSAVRVRLLFDFPPPAIPQSCMFWFLLDRNRYRVVADLASVIRDRFFYGQRGGLSLYVEECLLPPGESALVVRDNDCIKVKWDASPWEEDTGSTTRIVCQRKKSKKRSCENSDKEEGESGGSVTRKAKKPRRRSSFREDLESLLDPGSEKRSKKKKASNGCTNSNSSTKRPKKRQKRDLKEKTGADDTQRPTWKAPEDKRTEGTTSSEGSDASSESSHESQKGHRAATGRDTPSTGVSVSPRVANAAASGKVNAVSSTGPDTDSRRTSSLKGPDLPSQRTLCASSSDSSDSDTLVIKKALPGADPPNKGLLSEKVHEGPLANPQALGRGLPRGRGDFSWRAQRGHFFRLRGGSRNHGRGRGDGNNYYYSYNADGQKQQQLNESVSNHSTVIQNPLPVKTRDYGSLPLLAAPPQLGRVIAFKLLELSENYSPEVSDYKEGRVLSYDPLTEQLKLEILSHPTKEKEPGKFDLVYEAEDGTNIVEYAVPLDTKITQSWSALIEPRLIVEEGVEPNLPSPPRPSPN
ncbi:coilin [Spea bombifrons]|uniref:coilin n=1 Tax=Spea bombifrons TaxID=233779 RepID=UPI002349F0D6|nr:coilin [Spea bombifrons]